MMRYAWNLSIPFAACTSSEIIFPSISLLT